MSARAFEPVFLEAGIGPKLSVTFGRHENVCSRAGFLYAKYRGGASTHAMERGSALHRVLQLATQLAVDNGEPMVPPEVVKDLVAQVLADPVYRCPIEEQDYLRESAYRWAEEATFDASTLIACETMFSLDIGGFEMRGVIDRADLIEDGAAVSVTDYKSSRAMPSFEDLGRKRPDGSIAAKDYQLVLYALLLAFGVPVRREGDEEIREPFGVADRAQRFDLAYVFPGINAGEGMGRRDVSLTRLELVEYRASLEAQMSRVAEAIISGQWPATSGDHCSECPCSAECPIPSQLRAHAGTVNSIEQAVEAAEQLWRAREQHQARWDEIKRFVKAQVPGQRLRFGRDQVIEPTVVVKRVIRDKDGLWAAIERMQRFGEPFDASQFEKVQTSTPLTQRRLSEDELVAEAGATTSEGSNA